MTGEATKQSAGSRLSDRELSVFCSGLSMMLSSGISPAEACELFAQDNQGTAAQASAAMAQEMMTGSGFTDAARSSGVFPEYALGVFQAAQYAGRLEETLGSLAQYYDRQERLAQQVKNTLTYPAVLLVFMCAVLAVLTFGVLPVFERVYSNLTGSIVSSSYAYILAAGWIARTSLIAAAAVALVLLGVTVMAANPVGKARLVRRMETFFLTKKLLWKLAVSRAADTLSVLMASGVDTDSALEIAADLTTHTRLKATLKTCLEQMRQGSGLAMTLYENGVFTALYGRMLVGGFESGKPEQTLSALADRMNRDAEWEIANLMDWAEPVLIGFLAVSVGLTLLSIMLPLLGILGAV